MEGVESDFFFVVGFLEGCFTYLDLKSMVASARFSKKREIFINYALE